MTERNLERREEALKRAQEIYERLVREQRWDFHNIPAVLDPPAPVRQAPGEGSS
ncbi:MAG TPA: hypothetical protein VHG28_16605 [Longimicrobiaceae bacterium]|nr:hypothetical protein [Longimicrobiaceae bacterium]